MDYLSCIILVNCICICFWGKIVLLGCFLKFIKGRGCRGIFRGVIGFIFGGFFIFILVKFLGFGEKKYSLIVW